MQEREKMMFETSLFILVGVCGLTVDAQAVDCSFGDFTNEMHYACALNTSSLSYGTKPTSIFGEHESGKTDDDVKLMINYEGQVLQTLTSIFCDKFRNLEKIVLRMDIEVVDEDAFWKCQSLRYLKLWENSFRQLPAKLLVQNRKLQTISITQNSQLSSLPQNFFENQNQLEFVTLDENNLKVIEPKWFENLVNLEELKIQRNKLTEVPGKCFKSLKNLEILHLGRNEISILHPDSFFGLENLEVLSILKNQLTDLPSGVFAELKKLKELSLASNRLTTIHSDFFGLLPNLWAIRINDNEINSIDEKIVDSTALKLIHMTDNICFNDFIEDETDAIKSALKTCFSNYRPRPRITEARQDTKISQLSTDSCGRSTKVTGTIIGGTFISRGDFPWLAVLASTEDRKYFCGGVLVSNRKVVTAAHCMLDKGASEERLARSFVVSLGTHDLNNPWEPGRSNYAVQTVVIHPDWNPSSDKYDADIAVLFLDKVVTFTRYIQPICLIPTGSPAANVTEGTVVGYGKSEDQSKDHENIAKVLDMPIVDPFDCLDKFRAWAGLTSRRTFCGGWANGTGVCKGDSGGGLYVKHGETFYLRGIISASFFTDIRQCDVNALSLFTDVPKFHDWIEKVKGNEHILDKK